MQLKTGSNYDFGTMEHLEQVFWDIYILYAKWLTLYSTIDKICSHTNIYQKRCSICSIIIIIIIIWLYLGVFYWNIFWNIFGTEILELFHNHPFFGTFFKKVFHSVPSFLFQFLFHKSIIIKFKFCYKLHLKVIQKFYYI